MSKNGILATMLVMSLFLLPSVILTDSAAAGSTSYCTTGSGKPFPLNQGVVFDPLSKYTYVYYASTVFVFSGTCTHVSTINFGTLIRSAAYNPMSGTVYVNLNNNTALLYKGTTLVGRISIALPGIRISDYYSLSSGSVYVATGNGTSTTVPSSMIASVIGNMSVRNAAYNPSTNEVYSFTQFQAVKYVKIYGIACSCAEKTITLSTFASGIAFNPSNLDMYVSGYLHTPNNTGTVTVISTSTKSIVTVIGVGKHVEDVAYSPKTGEIYATNYGSVGGTTSVSMIKGLSVSSTLALKGSPDAIAYNPINGLMYVTLYSATRIAMLSV